MSQITAKKVESISLCLDISFCQRTLTLGLFGRQHVYSHDVTCSLLGRFTKSINKPHGVTMIQTTVVNLYCGIINNKVFFNVKLM